MHFPRILRTGVLLAVMTTAGVQGSTAQISAVGAEFVGSTPCGDLPRQFMGITRRADCERITWQITISSPSASENAGRYRLAAVHGMQERNAPGFAGGGNRVELQGTWTTVVGTPAYPDVTVYRLTADGPQRSLEFALLDQDLLHPLDASRRLMVGNPSWSYTLSRRNPIPRSARIDSALAFGPVKDWAGGADGSGVFEGRTACRDLAQLLHQNVGSDCFKLKWQLTLRRDSATHEQGTYRLEGTLYRRQPRTGRWTIRRTSSTPSRVIYVLDSDTPSQSISLWRADEDVLFFLDASGGLLVGNELFSYTMNRVRPLRSQSQ